MALALDVKGDAVIRGDLSVTTMTVPAAAVVNASVAAGAAIERSKLAENALAEFPINMLDFGVHDALATRLPGTSATDDLGLYGGTYGTNAPLIRTYDVKAAGAVTLYARALVPLPECYQDGEDVQIRCAGGMVTTVAGTTATVDVEAWRVDKDGTLGAADLCADAAQSINSLTFANKDFDITPTTLVAGDFLDVRITIAVNDAASGTAVIAALANIALRCDIKG